MELVEEYLSIEKGICQILSFHSRPILMSKDMTLEITINMEILHLMEVKLNGTIDVPGYLSSWKNGSFKFSLPPDMELLRVEEVWVKWS